MSLLGDTGHRYNILKLYKIFYGEGVFVPSVLFHKLSAENLSSRYRVEIHSLFL